MGILPSTLEHIRLRGVRQNNLKGFDLDLPLGHYIVVTGLSGAGKSSLVFDTLHAEGQRRYVETFSAYTRQFLDLLNPPQVDRIENIRPSIAIEQKNTVKTSRSTVGTMTELTDFCKVWFSQVAECFDPTTGEKVEDDTPETIWRKTLTAHAGETLLLAFRIIKPENLSWEEILTSIKTQGYTRVLIGAAQTQSALAHKLDELLAQAPAQRPLKTDTPLLVIQDRLRITAENHSRFLEACETALRFGQGEVHFYTAPRNETDACAPTGHFSRGMHSPATGRSFRPASPALFSFNSPLGACPKCRGFGRVIEVDYRLAVPDHSLSLNEGAIKPWEGEIYSESKRDLARFARRNNIPMNVPFAQLSEKQRKFVIEGDPAYNGADKGWPNFWYGLKGFFSWLETKTYKMHVRVFLSRYRAYNTCPECSGARLQPEALCWRWQGRSLPELYQLPVADFLNLLETHRPTQTHDRTLDDRRRQLALDAILTRLRYLCQVGLGYLSLDRSSRTLSGGEVQRVNLTSCLGTSLVDTLFVLDEPSVGLHPRDIDRLIGIIRRLTDAGNTVVVVEHDEAMIRAADHVLEIGPEPGARGGNIVFQGDVAALLSHPESITGRYHSGREQIPTPELRRPCLPPEKKSPSAVASWLTFRGATKHNLRELTVTLPLRRFVCLSGVSGSGKSTLLNNVIHQGLLSKRGQLAEDPAGIVEISGHELIDEIVLVDQSPLSRTPRSNPALHCEAWEKIRELYAATPEAQAAGFSSSSFSFNTGEGRCPHCLGLGAERVDMQFLSDVFVPCPVCEGRRFTPEVLAIQWQGRSVADLLNTTVSDALGFFTEQPEIHDRLSPLAEVGLGYLTLGQPLNTLSGGEAQRLKLVRYLGGKTNSNANKDTTSLLLLDEPTTGLHRHDVKRLLTVLQRIASAGHSVVVIEHHTDVLKSADWLIEIGPEAGVAGGLIVAAGTPEQVARAQTATAPFLRAALGLTPNKMNKAQLMAAESAVAYRVHQEQTKHAEVLQIHGARENNLRNLSLAIPHRQLSVVTGVSGSGKSTLAFDIVFAEGQRRFMESMSSYARQFVEQLPRPDLDLLTGIPPTVAIEQRITRGSRKSTVATITEVAQFLRLLYAKLGVQHHPESGRPVTPLSNAQLLQLLKKTMVTPSARRARHLYLCAPLIRARKGHHEPIAKWISRQGFKLMRADGRLFPVTAFQKLDRYKEHDIEVVIADLKALKSGPRILAETLDRALQLGKGACFLLKPDGKTLSWFSNSRTDIVSGESFPEPDPKHFSFNSPKGWCPACRGHGALYPWLQQNENDEREEMSPEVADALRSFDPDDAGAAGQQCPLCDGERLNRVARAVKLPLKRGEPLSLTALLRLTPSALLASLNQLKLERRGQLIIHDILPQIASRLRFLDHVGLGYLSLDRATETLSGGEAQRIRLAAQLGSNLTGVLYVLDEPSIGLHVRDNERLIATLQSLRDAGNTLLVVEHDDALMERADRIIDLGPGAGRHGGQLLANDTPAALRANPSSLTGLFLSKGIAHPLRGEYRPISKSTKTTSGGDWLTLTDIRHRNLQGEELRLPLARLVMVCGPSGAGKSTLFRDLLHPAATLAAAKKINRLTGRSFTRQTKFQGTDAVPFSELRGAEGFKAIIEVDQAPIGKTPRSTPATYLGIFDLIRQFFATLPEARMHGYSAGRFSFNTAGGRCETCSGAGRVKLEMAFMADTYLTCDACGGTRYGPELLDIKWKDRSIAEVLALTFEEATVFFDFHTQLRSVCQLMVDCGLGYLTLGQSSPTLSGGEAQRLKLVTELARGLQTYTEHSRGLQPRNLYLLEEPTIGLHLSDCEKLIRVLHHLVDQGHTVVVIEHHLDMLAEADWLVELGPGGGPQGGRILYQGPLKGFARIKKSPTAPFLCKKFGALFT